MNIASGLVSNLSIYDKKDYRRFLLAHLQYLTSLCQISIQAINTTINQFLSSLLVTNKVLTEIVFFTRLHQQINQTISNGPIISNQLLFLIRNINDGNSIISAYESNFEYTIRWHEIDSRFIHTQAIIYDKNCSCGLRSDCTTQARFIKTNSSSTVSIKGLKMGCTPSDSFHLSTLECFYDSSCIDLIQEYTNRMNSTYTLSTTKISRFLINTTIAELVNNLFIETWKTTTNYSFYFKQCAPSQCSYNYIHQFNSFHTISLLLGIEGGLTIVLGWICPKIVQIIFKFNHYRKRQTDIVHPAATTIPNLTVNSEPIPTVATTSQYIFLIFISFKIVTIFFIYYRTTISFRKLIVICVLLLCVIAALIIFSIYFGQQEKNEFTLTSMIYSNI